MSDALLRGAALPLLTLWSPGAALDDAPAHPAAGPASLLLLLAALGAASLPRLLGLLDAALPLTGQELLDAHLGVLRAGLTRLLVFERLVPPLPYLMGGTVLWLLAAPMLAGRRATRRGGAAAVAAVLAVALAPLLVQRLGELAVVLALPADGRVMAGDVAGLPARFNVGAAGVLTALGVAAPGWLGIAAEAANGVGLWVVALWGWGLSRLDRDAGRSARAPHTLWWYAGAAAAYAAGWGLYGAGYPTLLLLVMGSP